MSRRMSIAACVALFLAISAAPAFAQEKPAVTPHDLAGKENCLMCHSGAMEGMKAVPASHEGRGNETCQNCHAEGSMMQTGTPTAIPHDMEGKETCGMCHSGAMEGMPAAPESHEGFEDKNCTMCHAPKG